MVTAPPVVVQVVDELTSKARTGTCRAVLAGARPVLLLSGTKSCPDTGRGWNEADTAGADGAEGLIRP